LAFFLVLATTGLFMSLGFPLSQYLLGKG